MRHVRRGVIVNRGEFTRRGQPSSDCKRALTGGVTLEHVVAVAAIDPEIGERCEDKKTRRMPGFSMMR